MSGKNREVLSREEGGEFKYMATMYCVKCRAKKEVDNPQRVTMKNGKPAMKAVCPTCGTQMFKIGAN